jgi:hypothetical protein
MVEIQANNLLEFIEGYIDFILDREAQILAWRHHPCEEWLESIVDQWEVVKKQSKYASPRLIQSIDKLIEAIEEFYVELDAIGENIKNIDQYIQTVQRSKSWLNIVFLAKQCKSLSCN